MNNFSLIKSAKCISQFKKSKFLPLYSKLGLDFQCLLFCPRRKISSSLFRADTLEHDTTTKINPQIYDTPIPENKDDITGSIHFLEQLEQGNLHNFSQKETKSSTKAFKLMNKSHKNFAKIWEALPDDPIKRINFLLEDEENDFRFLKNELSWCFYLNKKIELSPTPLLDSFSSLVLKLLTSLLTSDSSYYRNDSSFKMLTKNITTRLLYQDVAIGKSSLVSLIALYFVAKKNGLELEYKKLERKLRAAKERVHLEKDISLVDVLEIYRTRPYSLNSTAFHRDLTEAFLECYIKKIRDLNEDSSILKELYLLGKHIKSDFSDNAALSSYIKERMIPFLQNLLEINKNPATVNLALKVLLYFNIKISDELLALRILTLTGASRIGTWNKNFVPVLNLLPQTIETIEMKVEDIVKYATNAKEALEKLVDDNPQNENNVILRESVYKFLETLVSLMHRGLLNTELVSSFEVIYSKLEKNPAVLDLKNNRGLSRLLAYFYDVLRSSLDNNIDSVIFSYKNISQEERANLANRLNKINKGDAFSGSSSLHSTTELKISQILRSEGYLCEEQKKLLVYTVDFYIYPDIIIEFDGFSHFYFGSKEKKPNDLFRLRFLKNLGYKLISINYQDWSRLATLQRQTAYLNGAISDLLKPELN